LVWTSTVKSAMLHLNVVLILDTAGALD
jgi:hypothetical protein